MQELAAEGKRNRRLLSSVATISRAAQQMTEDVMKEATVEASHRTDKRALRESKEALCEEHGLRCLLFSLIVET